MVQLKSKRTALGLYTVLLILPTAVLGWLLWDQLVRDHEERVREMPAIVEHATRKLVDRIEEHAMGLVYSQDHESYYAYRDPFIDTKATRESAPQQRPNLVLHPRDEILFWFEYDSNAGPEAKSRIFDGIATAKEDGAELRASLLDSLERLIRFEYEEDDRLGTMRKSDVAPFMHPLLTTTAFAAGSEHLDDVLAFFEAHPDLYEKKAVILIYAFHLRFFRTPETGEPRLLATRSIVLEGSEDLAEFEDLPEYLHRARDGFEEIQGFFIDPTWFFETMPRQEAALVLQPDMQVDFIDEKAEDPRTAREDFYYSDIAMVKLAGLELFRGEGRVPDIIRVSATTDGLNARFAKQRMRFFGMAAMLGISLLLGMLFLLRTVRRDLEQAQRAENFVASVTHELRTPLTAIRLYSEMLKDGWVPEGEKRSEYYQRILRETNRLETLVERVLAKARLSSSPMKTISGDLNEAVLRGCTAFSGHAPGDRDDHQVFLAESLPSVRLNRDAVSSILTNLVENARKYAAPKPAINGDRADEPIRIETRLHSGRVVLEVSDRGPGIPEQELPNIFQAFYRIGTEATRTAKGTGLGLHLVALQCESMGGEVEALSRQGGGTTFRVSFAASQDSPSSNGHANGNGQA